MGVPAPGIEAPATAVMFVVVYVVSSESYEVEAGARGSTKVLKTS